MIFRNEVLKSPTLRFSQAAAQRISKRLPIISLGLGEPDFDIPEALKQSIIEVVSTDKSGYSDPKGLLSLREKIAAKLIIENSIQCTSENIIVTAGSKQAFTFICMSLIEPGDEIIIIDPSFVSYVPQLFIAEPSCRIVTIDINKSDFSLSIDSLEKSITKKTKLLIINSPNNPAGYILSLEILKEIYNLSKKNGFYIISDEVYERLIFSNNKHFSIGSLEATPDKVITLNSFSKSHALSGWGLGYACFPLPLRDKLLSLQKHINTNTSTIIQRAVEKSFDIDQTYLIDYNRKLFKRSAILDASILLIRKISLIPPKAGFFAFLNISGTNLDSSTFCCRLIEETGVALTPGIAFGNSWDNFVRISFATSEEILKTGLELLMDFADCL
jgi:aspartate/methionine/tyrosine aminotransferase